MHAAMFSARITFPKGGQDAETAAETATDLLAVWQKNGQIVDKDWVLADAGDIIDAYVTLPQRDSLDPVYDNRYVTAELERRRARGWRAPAVTILGEDPETHCACSCTASSALVLFTTYLSCAPPIRCLDCFDPVPLYRLPHIEGHEHLRILHWAADYRACDTLQMHCTVGERFGEAQLYRHDSALSRLGRDLGARLEAAIGKPVYYFLLKSRGRSREKELARKCPSCGGDWRMDLRLFDLFDFRCEGCRLLSAIASDC